MKKKVDEAVGYRTALDLSAITPEFKGAIIKRGEIIEDKHVELLKKHGHYYVYVEEGKDSGVWEDEAVVALGKVVVSDHIEVLPRSEGKAFLIAREDGLVLVNREGLKKLNLSGIFVLITVRNGAFARVGDVIGVVDMVPLTIPTSLFNEFIDEFKKDYPLISLHPSRIKKIGIVVTGNEIVDGLKEDLAGPIIERKIKEYGCSKVYYAQSRDDENEIADTIIEALKVSDAVVVSGGMSVDPTDKTPEAIRKIADKIVFYGIPIKPTTMSMLAYREGKAILGVSSGIIYFPDYNVLDVILPWIVSNVEPTRDFIAELGEGGLSSYFLGKLNKK
ncbi:MAG: molybdopterin-binding protein [Thermosphaera sp.]